MIIDRVKNIFKLSQGEYISPEKVENVLILSEYLTACFIHGDSTKDYAILIACVDPAKVKEWAKAEPTEEMCKNPEFIDLIVQDLKKLADAQKLNSLERPK